MPTRDDDLPGPLQRSPVKARRTCRDALDAAHCGSSTAETAGGVDELGHTRAARYERARALGVHGRSRLTKHELATAIARAQD